MHQTPTSPATISGLENSISLTGTSSTRRWSKPFFLPANIVNASACLSLHIGRGGIDFGLSSQATLLNQSSLQTHPATQIKVYATVARPDARHKSRTIVAPNPPASGGASVQASTNEV